MTLNDVQRFLNIPTTETDKMDEFTEAAIRNFQLKTDITPTGQIDQQLIDRINKWNEGYIDTDFTTTTTIKKYYLNKDEYLKSWEPKRSIFLHHTAGWGDPYNQVSIWERDNRGPVGTAYLIGGKNPVTNTTKFDGEVIECMPPDTSYAWHLGIGNNVVHRTSMGIELCNFGWISEGKTWSGARVHSDNIVRLSKPYRGYITYQRYSDAQIIALRNLLVDIGKRTGIDITLGLQKRIKTYKDVWKAFDYDPSIVKTADGLFSHSNVSGPNKFGNYEKWDIFPQDEIIDMIKAL